MAEENKSQGAELFELLNKDEMALSTEDKERIQQILEKDSKTLVSPEFIEKVTADKDSAKKVLENLVALSGENGTAGIMNGAYVAGIKNPAEIVACASYLHRHPDAPEPEMKEKLESFIHKNDEQTYTQRAQEVHNEFNPQPITPQPGKESENSERESVNIEGKRGELNVETWNPLTGQMEVNGKAKTDKKIANLNDNDGDLKKSREREPSKEKFKDEDVVKYMYEEWFLAGASWLYNKAEYWLLGAVDYACDNLSFPKTKSKNPAINTAQDNIEMLRNAARESINNGNNLLKQDSVSRNECIDDLQKILKDPTTESKHWDTKNPETKAFIDNLRANPDQAEEFINLCKDKKGPINNALENMKIIQKIAMLQTNVEMTDEYLQDSKAWNGKNQVALKEEQEKRAEQNAQKLTEALKIIEADARLTAEAVYEEKGDTGINKEEWINSYTQKQTSEFLKNTLKDITEAQNKQIECAKSGKCSENGQQPDAETTKAASDIRANINTVINEGQKNNIILEEAKEMSPYDLIIKERGSQNTTSSIQESFAQQQAVTESRRQNVNARKQRLEEFKKSRMNSQQNSSKQWNNVNNAYEEFKKNKGRS